MAYQDCRFEISRGLVEPLVGILSGDEADQKRSSLVRRRVVHDRDRTSLAIHPGNEFGIISLRNDSLIF